VTSLAGAIARAEFLATVIVAIPSTHRMSACNAGLRNAVVRAARNAVQERNVLRTAFIESEVLPLPSRL